jgi:hypothetical protein
MAAALALLLWVMLPRGVTTERRAAAAPVGPCDDLHHAAPFRAGLGHGIYAFLFLALVTYLPAALGALAFAGPAGGGADRIAPDRAARAPDRAGAAGLGRVPDACRTVRAGLGGGPAGAL